MNVMKYMLVAMVVLLASCSRSTTDYAEEDYDLLFPFAGIEKPKVSYEDQIVQLGNPDAPVSDFVYPGVEINTNVRTYNVTLTCQFREVDILGNNVPDDDLASRFVVRYVPQTASLLLLPATPPTRKRRNISPMANRLNCTLKPNRVSLCISLSMVLAHAVRLLRPLSRPFQKTDLPL